MAATHKGDRPGGPSGRGPREDHPAEAPFGASGAATPSTDPELLDDLGAEFELRGDVVADELETARSEAAEWKDKALRAQADFENTRKRLEGRHADALLRAGERIIENLIPVIDDLDAAIAHAAEGASEVREGLDAVRRKLLSVLEREGCSVIDPVGQPFDIHRHQAVQMREDASVPDQTVVEVFQKGYEMHSRILRSAMVVVSTGGPSGK